MELTKCKLGELITQRREKNDGSDLPICGVSKDGLIPPKQKDADTSIYNVFYRDDFIFNPARMELNSIAINDMYDRAICSSLYEVFYVHRTDLLLPHYLELIIRQKWFTRYCKFLGQGSAREYCRFGNISEIEIEFPPIEEQQKIVEYNTAIENRIALKQKINDNLEAQAEAIYNEMIANNSTNSTMSTLGEISTIKTGKLNSEAAVTNGIYPFFTCSQETYRTNTFSFDQEAVLLAGNNASAIYPLKIYCGKFDVYQRTYVISSNNRFVSNKQLYFVLKQQLNEFKGISSGTTTKFLTMKILTPIPVVIAPEDISTSFINITNKMFETIFQNQREIEHLHELQMIVLGELSRN